MHLKLYSLMFFLFSLINPALAEVKGDNYRETNQNIENTSDLGRLKI